MCAPSAIHPRARLSSQHLSFLLWRRQRSQHTTVLMYSCSALLPCKNPTDRNSSRKQRAGGESSANVGHQNTGGVASQSRRIWIHTAPVSFGNDLFCQRDWQRREANAGIILSSLRGERDETCSEKPSLHPIKVNVNGFTISSAWCLTERGVKADRTIVLSD